MTSSITAPKGTLTLEQALDRLRIVSLIQLLGIVLTLLLLGSSHFFVSEDWQLFCWVVGAVASFLTLVILVIAFCTIEVRGPNWAERMIQLVFLANTVALAFGMARTGGASNSVFSYTIPIQLSGMLLLELRKDKLTLGESRAYWWYAGITIFVWVTAEVIAASVFGLLPRGSLAYEYWRRIAAAILVFAGTLFTVITYKFPTCLLDRLKRWVPVLSADPQTPSQTA